ncbi:MAG: porin [Bryobacteraceae bacterium]
MIILLLLAAAGAAAQTTPADREQMLLGRIEKLEQRLAALEAKATENPTGTAEAAKPNASQFAPNVADTRPEILPAGTTINVNLDGYYAYNFNRPFPAMNSLRAYDVSSNSFALNQAGIILERAPDLASGRRIGGRLDLMFGQATETLQASPANERRPEVFRHIFQAYGTYVAPLGKGLTVDFGKWASSFGIENNYTKDQWNYSRSFWFGFLPYYHMGIRATYPVTGKWNASYWVTNGLNQTEDFNAFKSQAVLLNFNPSAKLSANLNYFAGQEERTVNGQTPNGRSHILDSYITWHPGDRWTLALEGDYFISRATGSSAPRRVAGGAAYAGYQFHPRLHLNGRFEFLDDSGGLFSGTAQSLKEATATATFDVAAGFQMRWEVRRDWSNIAFFPVRNDAGRARDQTTALLGLIWWFGGKPGAW